MSFRKIQFSYTPPQTVPSASRISTEAVTPSGATVSPNGTIISVPPAETTAGHLIARLNDLHDASEYLQTAILAGAAGSGISFTPEENPDLANSLSNIYKTDTPPPGITTEMYSNMLDAELGAMKLQSVIGPDGNLEVSGQNIADLMTSTKAFEKGMIASLSYQPNLVPLVRSLKGDQVIYRNMAEQLASYPAYVGTSSTASIGLDVSSELEGQLTYYLDDQAASYSKMFSLLSTASNVEYDIAGVMNFYLSATVSELSMIFASFSALREMFHGVKLQDIADDMTNFMFVMLISEVSAAANTTDRLFSLAVSPFKSLTTSAAIAIRNMQAINKLVGSVTSGSLKGMVHGNPCSATSSQASYPSTVGSVSGDKITSAIGSVLGDVSSGLNSVFSHLQLATETINRKNLNLQESLRKALSRRIGDQNDRLDLLCSLRNLEASILLLQVMLSSTANGPIGSTAVTGLQAITRVLSSFSSPTGASFSVQNNNVIVTPPSVPPVTESVQRVLNAGGTGLVTTSDLSSPSTGA